MHSRFAVPILCAAAIAFACGPRSHAGDSAAAATAAAASPSSIRHDNRHSARGPVIASSLDVSVAGARTDSAATAEKSANAVTLTFHVTNNTDKHLELTFPSGQTHDFVVLDSAGRAVWRWSADRMFTQALQNQLLESGETTTFDGRWEPGAARGRFTAIAMLKSDNHPIESRVEFSLP